MITQRHRLITLLLLPLALVAACDKVPLLAPTGSVITLFPVTTSVSLNSEVNIIATIIENGAAAAGGGAGTGGTATTTRTGAGTPVQNGTVITFTTTIGRIEPSEARTHNGQVIVKLITAGASGSATVTAFSGGASAQITNLKIGTAAAKTVLLTTAPQSIGASGGSVQVIASVTDEGGSPLAGVPVTFVTDRGSISPSTVTTDAGGNAAATLTTTATAKVTATAGTVTSSVATVTVNPRALAAFKATPAATSAGVPVIFTVTPSGSTTVPQENITNVRVDFGDGSGRDLGAINGETTTAHIYGGPGNYTATATSRSATGDSQSLSTSVIIGSLPITLTFAPAAPTVNSSVTFTAGLPESVQVDHFEWTLNDGTTFRTTSRTLVHTFNTRGAKVVQVDVIGVGGARIGSATTRLEVS